MTIFVCHLGAKHYNNWLENDVLTQLGGDKVDTHTHTAETNHIVHAASKQLFCKHWL